MLGTLVRGAAFILILSCQTPTVFGGAFESDLARVLAQSLGADPTWKDALAAVDEEFLNSLEGYGSKEKARFWALVREAREIRVPVKGKVESKNAPTGADSSAIRVSPRCAEDPGARIRFTFTLVNKTEKPEIHLVASDVGAVFLIPVAPNGRETRHLEVVAGVATHRLHLRAWRKSFKEAERSKADTLKGALEGRLKSIRGRLDRHRKLRVLTVLSETELILAVEANDPSAIKRATELLARLEKTDEAVLVALREEAKRISSLIGSPPETDAAIVRLRLLPFRVDPGNSDRYICDRSNFYSWVNDDDDDRDGIPDNRDTEVPDEDDMPQLWWLFARPIDPLKDFSTNMVFEARSPRTALWERRSKGVPAPKRIVISDAVSRRGVFSESVEVSKKAGDINYVLTVEGEK